MGMNSEIVITLVVSVAIVAHVLLYRWVRFKIQEGVILQFLRDARDEGGPDHHHADAIAARTGISVGRAIAVCRKSTQIRSDPEVENSWRAGS